MHIGLVVHSHREQAWDFARRTASLLMERGAEVSAEPLLAQRIGLPAFDETHRPEVLMSLGGDGTFLRCVQFALAYDVPLMGVNIGRLGFLADTQPDALEEAIDCLLAGKYTLETRPLMEVVSGDTTALALNDVVISRGGYARLISVTTLVDGEEAGRFVADGVILASPTGSTGYSLSAGGPIVAPGVDCMVITPVCAHSLQHRPTVVCGQAQIRFILGSDAEQTASVEVDGQSVASLTAGMEVTVARSPKQIQLIRTGKHPFFSTVREKLIQWTR